MASKIEADVKAILNQGHDPVGYRQGLASRHGVSVDVIDAAIATVGGAPRDVDPEDLALERMMDDRRMARENPAAYRAYNHEED